MGDLTRVTIDFETSHLVFPTIIGVILSVLGLAILVTHRHEIAGSGAYWQRTFERMDKIRFFGAIALTVVYFLLMVPVGNVWPNTGLGFLICSIPYVFLTGILFRARTRAEAARAGSRHGGRRADTRLVALHPPLLPHAALTERTHPWNSSSIMTPLFFALIVGGTFVGIVFGAIPGMTATMAVAICLPLTYSLGLENGLALLLGLYVGGISGGLVPAILLGIPGTPSSITTLFDGYPMCKARRGREGAPRSASCRPSSAASSASRRSISSRRPSPISRSASPSSRSS